MPAARKIADALMEKQQLSQRAKDTLSIPAARKMTDALMVKPK